MPRLLVLLCLINAAAQDTPKPEISREPLTAEQIAIYRAVLEYTQGGQKHSLNIANVTDPFYFPKFNGSCPKDDEEEPTPPLHLIVHRLDRSIALNAGTVLVDPDEQGKIIEKNDPEKLMVSAAREGRPMTDTEISKSVDTAFSTGLVSLSEIVFNKKHTRAMLVYSLSCGRRTCGSVSVIIVKKVRNKWKICKACFFGTS